MSNMYLSRKIKQWTSLNVNYLWFLIWSIGGEFVLYHKVGFFKHPVIVSEGKTIVNMKLFLSNSFL